MKNLLFQAICRTGIFMICAQAIVQFRPHESYEKYLKLLVGVMVLIQLFLPLGRIFLGADKVNTALQLEAFRESLEREMEEAKQRAEETDALLERMTLEEVRRRMEEQEVLDEGTPSGDGEAPSWDGEAPSEFSDGVESGDTGGGTVTVEVEPVKPILGE